MGGPGLVAPERFAPAWCYAITVGWMAEGDIAAIHPVTSGVNVVRYIVR